jgi:P-type Ca2+ transporter type 2C
MPGVDVSSIKGLSSTQVAEYQEKFGKNEIVGKGKKSFFSIIFEIVREPMFILLLSCGALYLFLGDIAEALMLLSFVFLVIGITIFQENKTERALDALRDLSSPRALVIRDGAQIRIAGKDVVMNDIIVLEEGDRVPADALLLSCTNLNVDESLLTGECMPVRKASSEGKEAMNPPGGDDLPSIYSGTLVVSGSGIAKVKAIGMSTEMGKIGKSLDTLKQEKTLLQIETNQIVKIAAICGLIICIIVVLVYGLTRNDWIDSILAGLTLAMSILPEEFPVVLTVFLALGAWRMSKKDVLARKQHAIQALGSATVLCVDKTGTLTLNQMTIKQLSANDSFFDVSSSKNLPESYHELLEFGMLASRQQPFDPMEKAIKDVLFNRLGDTEHIHKDWKLIQEYPLSRQLLSISHVWKAERTEYVIAAKGAPEAIADLCHFNSVELRDLHKAINSMAEMGLRVLGVAKAEFRRMPLPSSQHDFEFRFVGLLGFEDPVRPTVAESVKECYDAGIRVVMITGDYPGTAKNIGRQIGLKNIDSLITGPELAAMSDSELQRKIKDTSIFARVVPEQKLKIVTALKANKEIVAMTGDGVNDAPALKAANIGISMGARGTDVAREASSVVLLDDDFSSIVDGIRLGRRIFDNIRKAMSYVLAVHIPIAGVTLLAVLFKWPLLLFPAHIVFLELIIDPSCSIVFESVPEEKNIMKKSPRDPEEKIFNKRTVITSVLQGLFVIAVVASIFRIAMNLGQSEAQARAVSFCALVISNVGLIVANLSQSRVSFKTHILQSKNKSLFVVTGSAVLLLFFLLEVPLLQRLFSFAQIGWLEIAIGISAGILTVFWAELVKFFVGLKKTAPQ